VPVDPPDDAPTRLAGTRPPTPARPSGPPPARPGLGGGIRATGPALDLLLNGESDEEEATVVGILRPLDLPEAPKPDPLALDELRPRTSAPAAQSPAAVARPNVFDDDAPPAGVRSARGNGLAVGVIVAAVVGLLLVGAAIVAFVVLQPT
jgi:hypothetical protein